VNKQQKRHFVFKKIFFRHVITGSYNNHFRTFKRNSHVESTYEASLELCKPFRQPRFANSDFISSGSKKSGNSPKTIPGRKRKEEISADYLDFNKKVFYILILGILICFEHFMGNFQNY